MQVQHFQVHIILKKFHRIFESETFNEKKTDFSDWIFDAQNSGIERFRKCAETLIN